MGYTLWGGSRYGWLRGDPNFTPQRDLTMRTVYNPRTHEYEEIPLPQFQQLLRDGKIEESETQSPYDGHPRRVYRMV
jgi:hypothetical protein